MLALFTAFWCSTHLFYHSHIINGQVVVHSHPFSEDGTPHSQQELKLISILSVFISTDPSKDILRVALPHPYAVCLQFCPSEGFLQDFPVHLNGLRAPPAIVTALS